MKRLIVFLVFMSQLMGYGQDPYQASVSLPKIVPPSPEASAFHVYGNTETNNYTGSPNISIPLWEIKTGGVTIPIYLKYTAGNGVKVSDIASWVGLGWTLNTGGAISRTIRGIADEDGENGNGLTGFFRLNEIPTLDGTPGEVIPRDVDVQVFKDIADSRYDSQPDEFMYYTPSSSGKFVYDWNENIYYKPKKKIRLTNVQTIDSEMVSNPNCLTHHKVISEFALNDEYGNIYEFKDKEWNNKITANTSDFRGFPTTWYLTNIYNMSKTKKLSFEYESYTYNVQNFNEVFFPYNHYTQDEFTQTAIIGKRLKKIQYDQGSVEFIASTDNRQDLPNTKYLQKIVIKDMHNNIIKAYKFFYKYMTPNGLVDITTNGLNPNETRLILMSIEECDKNDNCLPPYNFTYDETYYLPSRFSKAIDHWGYYNGQIDNTSLEPKHNIIWNDGVQERIDEVGSADREADFEYGKSGILTKIQYPTGGYTNFVYEPQVIKISDNSIPREMTQKQIKVLGYNDAQEYVALQGEDKAQMFQIQLYSDWNLLTEVNINGVYLQDPNPNQCYPKIYIKNVNTGNLYMITLSGLSQTIPSKISLPSGNYKVWFEMDSENGTSQNCDVLLPNDSNFNPSNIIIQWKNEVDSLNKIVGGVRIKHIEDVDENNAFLKRYFSYLSDDNLTSSGRLINYPKYHQVTANLAYYVNNSSTSITDRPCIRYANPIIPLATTRGSFIGYGKVSIKKEGENGMEEFYYTTSDNFPDYIKSIDPETGAPLDITTYPYPETDDRDYLRGLLKKHIIYKEYNNGYKPVYKKEISYKKLDFRYMITPDNQEEIASDMVTGLKVAYYDPDPNTAGFERYYFTYYKEHTGYALPETITETKYFDNGNIETITTNNYKENAYGLVENYLPIKIETIDSRNNLSSVIKKYIFNKMPLTAVEQELYNRNALYIPLEQQSYYQNIKTGSVHWNFKNWGINSTGTANMIELENVQTKKGDVYVNTPLETRIIYHNYDPYGNLIEVSKADGPHIYYIYGYQHSKPIAKIVNFTQADAENLQAQIHAVVTASDNDIDAASEAALRTALDNLRQALPDNTQITTYTYDPLIGVTSITDPKGDTQYYIYDSFNRLKYIKDKNGHILKEYEYHYKQ